MKKIGILTNWNVPNYGAYLQAYAMQKVISGLCPETSVVQIAYLNKKHYDMYYGFWDFRHRLFVINPKTYIGSLKKMMLRRKAIAFQKYYKQIPNAKLQEGKEPQFDTVVLGSDIIWAYTMEHNRGDEKLFGLGVGAKRVISYAPSFGMTDVHAEVPSYVAEGLKKMAAVSVREENSAAIVERITGKRPQVVLDPTFLWDFESDTNVSEPSMSEGYILVYGSFFTDELINGAVEYAKSNGLAVICLDSLGDSFKWCDRIVSMKNMTPFEWLGYFKRAATVMTSTFHGLVFSLIFKKPIIFHPTRFILNKADDLIDSLGLREVLIEKQTFAEKIKYNWDYAPICEKLSPIKDESLRYLKEALADD